MAWEPGQERRFPSFDPATGTVSEAVATCAGIEPADLMGDTVDAVHLRIATMGTTTDVWVWNGQIVRELDAGLSMEMTRVPPGQGGDVTSTRDLYEVFAISSTPIAEPRQIGTRTFVLEGDIDWSAFQLDYPPVQVADSNVVTVSTCVPTSIQPFPPAVDGTFSDWLAPEPMVQADDPLITKAADSLTAGCADSWEAACALCRFVDAAVENTPTVSLPSSVEVLESRRGDCNEHTVLFVALARAAGLPARTCAGIVYLDGSFGYHAWPLVWVGQWVPMDPTFGQMVADPTHIILAEGNLESQYVITSVMGRLRITEGIVSAE
jgi:transglutaminase-like putative cysteine protease